MSDLSYYILTATAGIMIIMIFAYFLDRNIYKKHSLKNIGTKDMLKLCIKSCLIGAIKGILIILGITLFLNLVLSHFQRDILSQRSYIFSLVYFICLLIAVFSSIYFKFEKNLNKK